MLGHGIAYLLINPLFERIIAPHHPLQFGKFAHHARDQIGLGQFCRRYRLFMIGADQPGNATGQRGDPIRLVGHRPQFLVKAHGFECLRHLRHRAFAVAVEEKTGIGKPRGDDPIIAGDDPPPAIFGLDIGDHNVAIRKRCSAAEPARALAVMESKAFLMRFEYGHDHFRRQGEKGVIETAGQDHRPFHQPGIFGDKVVILDQLQPSGRSQIARAIADCPRPLVMIEHDLRRLQSRFILIEPGYPDRFRRHEAMALRCMAAVQPANLKRHGFAVKDA